MTIGYKKCYDPETKDFVLVELEIPEDAKVVSKKKNESRFLFSWGYDTDKCRASKATVKKLHGGRKSVVSIYDNSFVYEVGKEVTGDANIPWEGEHTCGNGIHYFTDKTKAIIYASNSYMFEGGDSKSPNSWGWSGPITTNRPKIAVYILTTDAICDDPIEEKVDEKEMVEVIEEKKPYWVVYVTQGQGEAEAGTYLTEGDAVAAVQAGVAKGDGSYRFLKVQPV